MEQNLKAFCQEFLKLTEESRPVVVVTMVGQRGEAPQDDGARMIVGTDGILFGTVGGGKIEAHCLREAQKILAAPEKFIARSLTWNLQRDIGMSCGGEVTLFFEAHRPQEEWRIAVFGAGHISQELTRVLLRLDCQLTVIDNRPEWLAKLPESPKLNKVHMPSMAELVPTLADHTFVVLMTMGHATDLPILLRALRERRFPYLGVIGSDIKRRKLIKELREQGLGPERSEEFFCPMGEDFGSNAPAEIALSVAGQLLKVRGSQARRS